MDLPNPQTSSTIAATTSLTDGLDHSNGQKSLSDLAPPEIWSRIIRDVFDQRRLQERATRQEGPRSPPSWEVGLICKEACDVIEFYQLQSSDQVHIGGELQKGTLRDLLDYAYMLAVDQDDFEKMKEEFESEQQPACKAVELAEQVSIGMNISLDNIRELGCMIRVFERLGTEFEHTKLFGSARRVVLQPEGASSEQWTAWAKLAQSAFYFDAGRATRFYLQNDEKGRVAYDRLSLDSGDTVAAETESHFKVDGEAVLVYGCDVRPDSPRTLVQHGSKGVDEDDRDANHQGMGGVPAISLNSRDHFNGN